MPDKLALWHTNFLQLFHRQYFMAVYHDYFHVFLAIQTSLWHDISGNVNPKKLFVPGKLMRFWLTLLNGWPYYRPRKLFFLFPLCFRFRFSCLCFFFCFFFCNCYLVFKDKPNKETYVLFECFLNDRCFLLLLFKWKKVSVTLSRGRHVSFVFFHVRV